MSTNDALREKVGKLVSRPDYIDKATEQFVSEPWLRCQKNKQKNKTSLPSRIYRILLSHHQGTFQNLSEEDKFKLVETLKTDVERIHRSQVTSKVAVHIKTFPGKGQYRRQEERVILPEKKENAMKRLYKEIYAAFNDRWDLLEEEINHKINVYDGDILQVLEDAVERKITPNKRNENIQSLKTIRNFQQQRLTSLSSERAKKQQELEHIITNIGIDIDKREQFLERFRKENENLRIQLSIIKGDELLRDVKDAVSGKTSPTILHLKAQDKPLAIRKAKLIREWLNLYGQNGTIPNDLRKKYSANYDVSNLYAHEVSRDFNRTQENTSSRIFACQQKENAAAKEMRRYTYTPEAIAKQTARAGRRYENEPSHLLKILSNNNPVATRAVQRVLAPLQKEYRELQASWNATKRNLRKCMVGAAVGVCAIAAIPRVIILGLEILRRASVTYRFLTADPCDPAFRAVLLRYQNQ